MNKEEFNFQKKCHEGNYGTFLIPYNENDVKILLLKVYVGLWVIRRSQTDNKMITASFVENNEIRHKRIDIDEITESSNSITAIVNKINKREIVNEYNLLDTTKLPSRRNRGSELTEKQLKISDKIYKDFLIINNEKNIEDTKNSIQYSRFNDTDYKKNQSSPFFKKESKNNNEEILEQTILKQTEKESSSSNNYSKW